MRGLQACLLVGLSGAESAPVPPQPALPQLVLCSGNGSAAPREVAATAVAQPRRSVGATHSQVLGLWSDATVRVAFVFWPLCSQVRAGMCARAHTPPHPQPSRLACECGERGRSAHLCDHAVVGSRVMGFTTFNPTIRLRGGTSSPVHAAAHALIQSPDMRLILSMRWGQRVCT